MATENPMRRFHVVIPCAGSGSRVSMGSPKQYALLNGVPMVVHTLRVFQSVLGLAQSVLVVAPDDSVMGDVLRQWPQSEFFVSHTGGATRAQSVLAGLNALIDKGVGPEEWVLVHDAARCLLTPALVEKLLLACFEDQVGGLLALPLPDTLKEESHGRVGKTLDRFGKWLAQTPQMFRLGMLQQALVSAGPSVTDEASAIENAGLSPLLVPSAAFNFKVTYAEDLQMAQAILSDRYRSTHSPTQEQTMTTGFRIGQGWDVHALVPGRPLVIGGVHIPYALGLLGHSDADVLLHAIIDALLGAMALGDIGKHFPDTDMQWKNADSKKLLLHVGQEMRSRQWQIMNIDATVIAQAPKLASHIPEMCKQIASILGLDISQVNIKAKTAEKLGPVGQGMSIEAQAMVLVQHVS